MTTPLPQPPPSHWRATFHGVYSPAAAYAPYEAWQFGINFGAPDGTRGTMPADALGTVWTDDPGADYTPAVDDLAADFQAFFGTAGYAVPDYIWGEQVKLALIGADGKYLADPWVATLPPNIRGTGTGVVYPPQMAVAVSTITERRGASGRGRFYIPAPASSTASGRFGQTTTAALAGSMATFLRNLANWPGTEPASSARPVVASSKGYLTPITGVRVGNRIDVIRSRAGQIPETYETVTL